MDVGRVFYRYRYVCALVIGMVAGSVYVNVFRNTNQSSLGIYNSDYLSVYADATVNYTLLWRYVLRCRLRDAGVLCLVGLTRIRKAVFLGYMLYIGACAGMLMSAAVMCYGILGILVCICSVMPQYILYAASLWFLYKMFFSDRAFVKKWRVALVVIILLLVGTYLEAYVNPALLKLLYLNLY